MLDRRALALLQPRFARVAKVLARAGVHAEAVTWAGFALGLAAAGAIVAQAWLTGWLLIALSRLADGLDGELARHRDEASARGAFLDITLDFLFYALIPLAFAWADPVANALAAATLLAAFLGTGSSFLAYAVLAERHGLRSAAYPNKGFYYLGGLTEASETLACFSLMCAWPQHFSLWAYGFAVLCGLTIVTRVVAGWRQLGGR
jgi:phosphatidylglycerophosphate synthase